MQKNLGRHIASLFVVLLFAIMAIGSVDTDSDTQDVQSIAAEFNVSADQLISAYKENEVSASVNYDEKVIVVRGTIQDIGLDILDNAYVILGGTGFLDGVQCTFSEGEKDSFANLKKGQSISVKGKVDGKMGNILISNCRLQ